VKRTLIGLCAMVSAVALPAQTSLPQFEAVQPELFAAAGGQPNAWADIDNDGDLDLFVGFGAGKPNRLYRNDRGTFVEIAAAAGIADLTDTRAAAWGDFDGDGNVDLYVGFTRRSETHNKLYRNDGRSHFSDVGAAMGVDAVGETRQVAWVDVDNDGDLDLFVAMRDAPNVLFRNDGGRFISVGRDLGLDDPRRTVGAVWFDADEDGDLDVFVANQNGDTNGFFRNDGTRFVDVARERGMDAPGRPETSGSNGPSVVDVDGDGHFDLFVAGYGGNFLYRGDGRGGFTDIARQMGVAGGDKATPSRWGDFDNDGRPDLYVSSYVDTALNEHDFLYHHDGSRLTEVLAALKLPHGATHGVQWADFDGDGDLDLALANNNPSGAHPLYRNLLPPDRAKRSVEVMVLDARGRATRAGSEVRVYAAGTRKLLGAGLVDTGSGYCSQNVMPVHVGLPSMTRVDVEVTTLTKSGRAVTRRTSAAPGSGIVTIRAR
jgi:VCBS repeat protein